MLSGIVAGFGRAFIDLWCVVAGAELGELLKYLSLVQVYS